MCRVLVFDLHQLRGNLLKCQKRVGLTQAEVVEKASLYGRTYADRERGKVNMREETLLRNFQGLQIQPNDVLTVTPTQQIDAEIIQERIQDCSPQEQERLFRIVEAFCRKKHLE